MKPEQCPMCQGSGVYEVKSFTEASVIAEAQEYHKAVRKAHDEALKACASTGDPERDHSLADDAIVSLLRALGYTDVARKFEELEKFYA